MKKAVLVIVAACALTAVARKAGVNQLPSVSADLRTQITPTKKMKNMDKGFPYEVRVDRETIAGKAIHWYSDGHAVTVTPHVVDCVRLTNTVDKAVITNKKIDKAVKKAAKKDAKNLEKAIKDLKKARDKSSDVMKEVYDPIIEMLEERSNG